MASNTQAETSKSASDSIKQALGNPVVAADTAPAVADAVDDETNSRTMRSTEEREFLERDMPWQPSRLLPTPDPIDGFDFRYVRVASGGTIDNMNHSAALRDGWQPVLAEEVPSLGMIMSDVGSESGTVVMGGMMLCKRPSYIGDKQKAAAAEQSRIQIDSVDRGYLNDQNSVMQKFSDKQTRVEFGKGS